MKVLLIPGTSFSPSIHLDTMSNKYEFRGSSRPENAVEFYTPVLDWLNAFKREETDPQTKLDFEFHFDYLNSISVKIIYDCLKVIEGIASKNTTIVWLYNKGDSDMKETGEEYQKLIKTHFIIAVKN